MSGWRSGSGRADDALSGALVEPTIGNDPNPRSKVSAGVFTVIVAGALVLMGIIGWREASLRPPHRALPPPVHGTVLIVPVGAFPGDRLADLPRDYGEEYGLALTVGSPIPLASTAWNATRRQYAAHELINSLRQIAAALPATEEAPLVVGVTQADIFIEGVNWNWAFGLRLDERFAVISTYRMPNTKRIARWNLFRKMLTRELGFLAWQLPPTDDPYDLLYRSILSADDLDRLSAHL
jgi:predicted Zn-dependent protease